MRGLHSSATVIQSIWRCHILRGGYQRQRNAAIVVQAHFRRWQVQERYQQQQRASVVLQTAWRSHAARQQLQREAAAQVIQKHYKGFQVSSTAGQQAFSVLLRCPMVLGIGVPLSAGKILNANI
jgi:predicted nucleotide-binding protein